MTDTTPLPCPFCNGEAELESESCGWRVACTNVECFTQGPWPTDCTETEALTAWNTRANADARLVEALTDAGASLAAAISLLERGGKAAKKAAPSDRMFDQMVKDYKASLTRARAALSEVPHG